MGSLFSYLCAFSVPIVLMGSLMFTCIVGKEHTTVCFRGMALRWRAWWWDPFDGKTVSCKPPVYFLCYARNLGKWELDDYFLHRGAELQSSVATALAACCPGILADTVVLLDLTQPAAVSWAPGAIHAGKGRKCQMAWQVLVWPLDPCWAIWC